MAPQDNSDRDAAPANENQFDKAVRNYVDDIGKNFPDEAINNRLLKGIARACGPSIYKRDTALVAASDDDEIETVRAFVRRRFKLTDAKEIDAGIDAVLERYGRSNRSKYRAVLYYQLCRFFGREDVFLASVPDNGGGNGETNPDDNASQPPSNGGDSNGPGNGGGGSHGGDNDVSKPTTFIDAKNAQLTASQRLTHELRGLKDREKKSRLNDDEIQRKKLLEIILPAPVSVESGDDDNVVPRGLTTGVVGDKPNYSLDDTYVALRRELGGLLCGRAFPVLSDGEFTSPDEEARDALTVAAVWGTLTADGVTAPAVIDATKFENGEIKVPASSARFSRATTSAFAQFNANAELYSEVLDVMAFAPDVNVSGEVRARDWVAVMDTLIAKGVTTKTPGLATLIRSAIDDRISPSNEKVTSTAQIILPDLEQSTAQEVLPVNLEAAQAIYFAAMMDEARVFDCVDKLAELFQIGALPLEKGQAGEYLYNYIRQTPDRIAPHERRNTYARVFGAAVGDPNSTGAQFREFDDLWLRFVSAVSDWYRKNQVENLFASNGRYVPSQEQVRKTGLDLAANLSLYCYGGTWFIASELQKDIAEYVDLLSSPEIRELYSGARDMWQVIDNISVLEFGRPVNTIRARTMANAGAIIIGWLENNAEDLSHPGSILISPADIVNPPSRSTSNSINDPSDYDLVTACEQWLAIEGVGEEIVDMKAAASPSASLATTPVRVPPAAQEILGAFGFSHDSASHPQSQQGARGGYTNGAMPRVN